MMIILKKKSSILLIISEQIKNQNEDIECCYTTINEVLPILSSTLEVVQCLISTSGTANTNENINTGSYSIMNNISRSLEFIKDENELLITNQRALNFMVEQQNDLLIQGIIAQYQE